MNLHIALALVFLATVATADCASPASESKATTRISGKRHTFPIDLPTALRLAGARNLDIQIAREKQKESVANFDLALEQLFPWRWAGVTYRRHDNLLQDVQGNIITVHKWTEAPGVAPTLQVDLGDALYKS